VTIVFLTLAGICVLLSAIVTAAESAVQSITESRVRTLVEEGFRGAEHLSQVRGELAAVGAAVLVSDMALNLTAVGFLTGEAAIRWGPWAILAAVPVSVVSVVVVSEALPRLIVSRQSIRLALLSSSFLLVLTGWLRPLIGPFVRMEEILEGTDDADQRELRELTELGRREGVVEEEEHELVERAFRMDELTAWDIMTPRVDVFAWPDSLTVGEVVPRLEAVPHSRVPVYRASIDHITGILYVREAYDAFVQGRPDVRLSALAREPFFVPGSLPLPQLLRDFQARRIHMGIVADEFGGTDGLVTLEDVIEELVGEIEDETDVTDYGIRLLSSDEAEAEGTVELKDVNDALDVALPQLEHRSLNGFILEELGRVPAAGETIDLPGLRIEIVDATETQVLRTRLMKTQPVGAQGS
jgi:CBS domain containing-hemolysin-like protein